MPEFTTVGCKHPNGIHLDLEANDGSRQRVTLRGAAREYGKPDHTVGGYALTEVDSAHWSAWYAKYKDCSLVKDRIVFAQAKREAAEKQAGEQTAVPNIAPPLVPDASGNGVSTAEKG